MSRKSVKILMGLIALVVVVLIVVVFTKPSTLNEPLDQSQATDQDEGSVVTARMLNDDGDYTIAGEVETPTPCYSVDAQAQMNDENTVTISLTSEETEDEVCAQVVSSHPFRISFQAESDAEILATLNDTPVTLNLVPVASEDALSSLDIKG